MAEGMMNPNTQEQLMLVQRFEQLANALGAEIPVSIDSEMAAVKNGMRMSEDLQRILAEGSMQFMNQLRPDQIGDMSQGTGTTSDSEMQMYKDELPRQSSNVGKLAEDLKAGRITQNQFDMGATSDSEMQMMQDSLSRLGLAPMTDAEMMGTYQVDDGEMQMTPSQMKAMQGSGAITPDTGRVMSLQEAIDAGFVTPTRPQARPTAPMQSMRPQTRR